MANDHNIHALPAEIVRPDHPLLFSERVAVAAFLAGYSRTGSSRAIRTLDGTTRPDAFTIGRRLSTLSSFYKYCQIEDIVIKTQQRTSFAKFARVVAGSIMTTMNVSFPVN